MTRPMSIAIPVTSITVLLCSIPAVADNPLQHNGVDKVYHPYVQPLERELELRTVFQHDDNTLEDSVLLHRLGAGLAISDRLFVEAYAIGRRTPDSSMDLYALELESKLQLTEQGEFWADWGVMLEVSTLQQQSISELSATLLMEKELGRWALTTNLGSEYEFGSDIGNEYDFEFAGQLRYRWSERLEPAMEIYKDEFTFAAGPVLQGLQRLGAKRKLHWEVGTLWPLNDATPDTTLRLLLEFEY